MLFLVKLSQSISLLALIAEYVVAKVSFERESHIFHSPTFESVVEEVVEFVESTDKFALPLETGRFLGPGIYLLYYNGDFEPYRKAASDEPIYVGKAVPKGRRQGRTRSSNSAELYNRIREHRRSISKAENLLASDFTCRFVILENEMADIVVTVESALIRKHRPLWNSVIDGFGNHDPGKGRYQQQPSEWDMLHPGRSWVEKLQGEPRDRSAIVDKVERHYASS